MFMKLLFKVFHVFCFFVFTLLLVLRTCFPCRFMIYVECCMLSLL